MLCRRASCAPGRAAAPLLLLAALLAGCSHDWDFFDPLPISGAGAAGPGGAGTGGSGAGGASASGGSPSTGGSGSGAASVGGGGSGGGAPALHCAGTHLLQDDFNDKVLDAHWVITSTTGEATVEEVNGNLAMTMPAASARAASAQVMSRRRHDLLDNRLRFEVVETLAAGAGSALSGAGAYLDSNHWLRFHTVAGQLVFSQRVAGATTEIGTVDHDLITQRYWQLRESGGTVFWETSPDGVSFSVQAQATVAALFPLDHVRIEMLSQTKGGEAAPGMARFASVNDGLPTDGGWCAASSLVDDFQDDVQSVLWSRSYVSNGATKVEKDGLLTLTPGTTAASQAAYISGSAYDLSESHVSIEVVQTTTMEVGTQTFVRLENDVNNGFSMGVTTGLLEFRTEQAGDQMTLASTPFDALLHRWWRLRASAGTVHWETSPDGTAWTERHQAAAGVVDLRAVDVFLGAQTNAASAAPGQARFDNVNLLP